MKTREEQIAEMAKEIRNYYGYKHLCASRVFYYGPCEHLYNIGYRKQSDTAREILDEVSRHFGGAWLVELYKKYGAEVEK